MDLSTYYSILEWQGENPKKIDPSTGKEIGRKIYEKDIELGKTVWVNDKLQDWIYWIKYHDPLLSLLSNLKSIECNEICIICLFILNISLILATMTATIGFNGISNMKSNHIPNTTNYPNNTEHIITTTHNDTISMLLCAIFNGLIICIFTLKWRQIETSKNLKLSTFIINQNGITIVMFIICTLCLGYYFISNEFYFYSWFVTIYAFQFLFGWIFEILTLYLSFIRGWNYDQKMMRLIPHYFGDGSFSHCALPKCVYYVTFKDYEEWMEYKQKRMRLGQNEDVEQPLLSTTDGNETSHHWLA